MAIKTSRNLMMIAGSFYIPKENEDKPFGEDAHFFCPSAQVIGIADGVGGWSRYGVDSGEYARELMRNAEYDVKNYRSIDVGPKQVLRQAYSDTAAEGSSTACIISLAGNLLLAANVGDSGFMVIRAGKTFYRSPVQQYGFNFPYQLQKSSGANGAEQAAELAVEVEGGDIVVAGTDGLFDNLFANEIETIVNDYCSGNSKLSLSEILATAALGKSLDKTTVSPFEVAAYEAGKRRSGGKYDDITVVVAHVVAACNSLYDDDFFMV